MFCWEAFLLIGKVIDQINIRLSRPSPYFYGNYNSWEKADQEAKRYNKGYDDALILKRVADATQMVREGKAAYERDSVCFFEESFRSELLSSFFYIISKRDKLKVLDFGGALGSTFFQNQSMFRRLTDNIDWNIVEQTQFVEYGNQYVPEISFYKTIEECYKSKKDIDCILLSSVLQYFDQSDKLLKRIFDKKIPYIIIDRQPFYNESEKNTIVLERVSGDIYDSVRPVTLLNEKKFISQVEGYGYKTLYDWNCSTGSLMYKCGAIYKRTCFKGVFFEMY